MIYIKLTNGSTTMLVNAYNETRQNELLSDGFYIDTDENGAPNIVNSESLLIDKDTRHADMLKQIEEKLNKNSKAKG